MAHPQTQARSQFKYSGDRKKLLTAKESGVLKARSNLKVDPTLVLAPSEQKKSFLGVYGATWSVNPGWAYISAVATAYFPDITYLNGWGTYREIGKQVQKILKILPSEYTRVTKKADHFIVDVPVFKFSGPETLLGLITALMSLNPQSVEEVSEALGKHTPDFRARFERDRNRPQDEFILGGTHSFKSDLPSIISAMASAATRRDVLKTALMTSLTDAYTSHAGGQYLFYLQFRINKAEAQFLVSTPWLEIRPQDVYPVMQAWVESFFGQEQKPPRQSFAVTKIARALPKDLTQVTPKVNEENLSCDNKGKPLYIPMVCDNSVLYEQEFSKAGLRADGHFQILSLEEVAAAAEKGEVLEAHAAPNIPVLVDWVNNRFAYTSTTGRMVVQNLNGCRAANAVHIKTWLDKPVDVKMLEQIANLGQSVGIDPTLDHTSATFLRNLDQALTNHGFSTQAISQIGKELVERRTMGTTIEYLQDQLWIQVTGKPQITWADIVPDSPFLSLVFAMIRKIKVETAQNMDNLYAKYSVSTTSHVLPYVILVSTYAPQYQEVEAKSNTITGPAVNQGKDPNWKAPPLPLVANGVSRLPHQLGVANELKDSPAFALLRVQPGGGKSMLAITDILQEFKKQQNNPYLIMCPTHLVPNYTKELVYFTQGRLNAIPITAQVVRFQTIDRLTAIIQRAPRNSVVVCSYDALFYQAYQVVYGTTPVNVFPVVELLRQFNFGYVLCDESQYIKNEGAARSRAVLNLISDIPMKRLASGTMAHDSASDLAMQIAMMDPTLFGTKEEFNKRFGEVVQGDRVVAWKPDAEEEILKTIRSRVVDCVAMRKEWAAFLPQIREQMVPVSLTEAQYTVYRSILEETLEKIRNDPKLMKKMKEDNEKPETEATYDEEDASDEIDGSLAMLLRPYLQRLEQFITAPGKDPLGKQVLKGDDLLSPKVIELIRRVRARLEEDPGKILIFTNYLASAEEIYEAFPSDLKQQVIHYKASEKVEAGSLFEKDPNKRVLVGVETSLNTGLNLQQCSSLFRVETVWTPGTLEQGMSRINRPELKKQDERRNILFCWILADRTIDCVKIARLTSKIVSVGKFENPENERVKSIEDLPIIRMSLEAIGSMDGWTDSVLDYAQAYSKYRTAIRDEYAEYKEEFLKKYGDNYLFPIEQAATPADAKIMRSVPYVRGLEIYGQDELGLVRLDEYLNSDDFGEELEEQETEIEDKSDYSKAVNDLLRGRQAHTELGDGEIQRVSVLVKRVIIKMEDETKVRLPWASVFVVTRELTSTKDIKEGMAKLMGDIPLDEPVDVPASTRFVKVGKRIVKVEKDKKGKKTVIEEEVEEVDPPTKPMVELQITSTNGYLGLTMFTEEDVDDPSARALEAIGFTPVSPFYYAEMKTAKHLVRQIQLWGEAGLAPDKSVQDVMGPNGAVQQLHDLMQSGKIRSGTMTYRLATRNKLQNFYKMEQKPSKEPNFIKPYPIIEDGHVYLALPIRGQMGTRKALTVKAPGVRWMKSDPQIAWYGMNPMSIKKKLQEIEALGIQITNLKELLSDWSKLKVYKQVGK